MMKTVWVGLLLAATAYNPLAAQEVSPANVATLQVRDLEAIAARQSGPAIVELKPGNRWMLICCGLPGDEVHREKLTSAVERIVSATEPVFEVAPNRLRVLVGDEAMAEALKDSKARDSMGGTEVCTADEIAASLQTLAKQIQANDSLWVIVMGHAQLYSGRSTFNVKGKDFDATEFSKWLEPVQSRERVLMLTMPVSGFWIKPLRGPKTVLISATDTDFEFTGTEMPYALANVLSGNSEQALEDIDQDGSISLLDLYLATSLEVHSTFKSMQRLQTEHALIDDNGDGVGRELQEPYIPVEVAESDVPAKPVTMKKVPTANSDGDFARTMKLIKPNIVPSESTAE